MRKLAGMRLTADLLNDNTADEEITTGVTAATDFTVSDFIGRKVNGMTFITVTFNRTGATIGESSAGSGNIGDTTAGTLPVGWRPQELCEAMWDSGFNDGGATINTSGVITLRTTSGSSGVGNGHNPRITAMWISENG